MTYLISNYARREIEFIQGEGNYLIDTSGKKYLDLSSGIGVNNLGYKPEGVQAALQKQMELLWHSPNLYQSSLQEKVASQLIGAKDYLAYFCNSGTEANEAAIKLIRKASGKTKIITFKQSFHGRTFGSMSATGQEKIQAGFGPLLTDFEYVPYNDIAAFKAALDQNTAGVMLEVVQGEGGVIPAEKAWLEEVGALCQAADVILAVDEIQTGIGRTGSFYASDQFNFKPDIITLAKALGNGLPVGAMLASKKIASAFGPGSHGSTFGGNRLALAAANAIVAEINQADFLAEVAAKGELFKSLLIEEIGDLPQVKAVRGLGLMLGIEVSDSPVTYLNALEKAGVIVLTAGTNVIRLLPPLTITETEIKQGVAALKLVLQEEGQDD